MNPKKKKKNQKESKNYLKKMNQIPTIQNLCDRAKTIFRGQFIAIVS